MTAENYAHLDGISDNSEEKEAKIFHIGLTIGALAADDCRIERRYQQCVSSTDIAAITSITDWFYEPERISRDRAAGTFLLQRAVNNRENGMDLDEVIVDVRASREHYQSLFSPE